MIGRTISHYKIISQLGFGGMGVVYRAEDVRLGRPVALKFVSEDYGTDEQALHRLRYEARAASALNHGNICTIYDVGEDDGRPFIVMELMKGENLRDRLVRGPLKVHQIVDIGIEIADALHATHSDGIIHRDIKPGNIFLTDSGHVKLLDFGLAKLTPNFSGSNTMGATLEATVAGVTLGTISYMSPEQATGEELDGRTDLFSLGVVLYECATGHHPFPGKTSAVTLAGILHKAAIAPIALNPELPLRLQVVLNNCLEKDRELRYQSAADLRADLKRVRRDIESGNTRTIDSATMLPLTTEEQTSALTSGGMSARVSERSAAAASQVTKPTTSRLTLVAGGAVVTAIIAAVGFAIWREAPVAPVAPGAPVAASPTAALSDATVQNRLALATASLQGRNYRAAAAYAAEVLAIHSGHAEASRIRDEAQAMLTRFDGAIADARGRIAAKDVAGAARALEAARTLDPSAPVVVELSSRLNEIVRQAEQSARALPRALPPPPAPARPTPSAPPVTQSAPPPVAAPAPAPTIQEPAKPEVRPAPEPPPPPPPAPSAPAQRTEPVAPRPEPVAPSAPSAPVAPRTEPVAPSAPSAPVAPGTEDDATIRRLAATYARAIETKDLGLFRSIKPNLSREEERRLQEGFRAVTSQRVNLTVVSIDRRGDQATVVVRRRDTIQAGGRQQTSESTQTMAVARSNGNWVIVDIR